VAEYNLTAMLTNPKEIDPFQMLRMSLPSRGEH
jgi:hypothetical protein